MTKQVISTKNLYKNYGNADVLKNININVNKGDIYALIGKNGAGKTTLMKILTGQTLQTDGEVSLFGDSENLNAQRHNVGTIIEEPSFFPYLSAKKNLEYYRIQRGIKDKAVVDELLYKVGLEKTGKKSFKNFSLGMKQRLGIALALMNSPKLLILDEPINGLDPTGIIEVRNLLKELNEKEGVTILISSHILTELSSLATRYGFINEGKLVQELTKSELDKNCTNKIVLQVGEAKKALVVMTRMLNVRNFNIVNDNTIEIYDKNLALKDISKAVISNNIELYSLEQKKANLEEYFLDVIGEGDVMKGGGLSA